MTEASQLPPSDRLQTLRRIIYDTSVPWRERLCVVGILGSRCENVEELAIKTGLDCESVRRVLARLETGDLA